MKALGSEFCTGAKQEAALNTTLPPELLSKPAPRATFHVGNTDAEVWCISDLLQNLPNDPEHQSNTQLKAGQIIQVFGNRKPAIVVAVGTRCISI